MILATKRLIVRELDSATDAEFICALLNAPKFIKYIGDRGVRTVNDAAEFIENRYRQSYRDHGFGLYAVELRIDHAAGTGTLPTGRVSASPGGTQIGMCGFVRRETLDGPDLGFAFLPEFERLGYGIESAAAMLDYGRDGLGFRTVFAITSLDNDASGKLLEKLGFRFNSFTDALDGERLKLFEYNF